MYEDVEVPPEIQRRVDLGFTWFELHVSRGGRALAVEAAKDGALNMGDIYEDVLAWAYSNRSDNVLDELDIDWKQAQSYGLRHVAADGKEYDDRSTSEDRVVAREYKFLTAAWYRKLTGGAARLPSGASTAQLLNALENME